MKIDLFSWIYFLFFVVLFGTNVGTLPSAFFVYNKVIFGTINSKNTISVIPFLLSSAAEVSGMECWRHANKCTTYQRLQSSMYSHSLSLSRLVHASKRALTHTHTPTHNHWKKTLWQILFTDMRIGFKTGTLSISI